jgi:transposase-like protein
MAVRWSLSLTASARRVTWLLAERGIAVPPRPVLTWTQTVGPQLAAEARKPRRRVGRRWYVDAVLLFRRQGEERRSLYRAVDGHGPVVDVLFRDQRDTDSARAFFRQALRRTCASPTHVIPDHHQPSIRAVRAEGPAAVPVRTGLHRARGETTKAVERSHVPIKDRLRPMRGLQSIASGQRVLEGIELAYALRRGHVQTATVEGNPRRCQPPHARARAAAAIFTRLARSLACAA